MTTRKEKSVLNLCDILTNEIDEVKHNNAQGLSLRNFSNDIFESIKRYNKDVHELGDACGSLYDVPTKRRRLSSMEGSDPKQSSSKDTEEETSEDCAPQSSNRSPILTPRPRLTRTEGKDNAIDNDNSKEMTALTPAPKGMSPQLAMSSTTVAEEDSNDDDNESSCSCPSIVVATQDASTQANRYIGDDLPSIILLNSRLNIKQLDLQQLNPESIEDIKKQLN